MRFVAIGGNLREIWALWADLQLVKSLQLSSNQELSVDTSYFEKFVCCL